MTYFEHLKAFNNVAVDFLSDRLKSPNYRGQHLVQHYRYDFDAIYKILELLNKYTPNQSLLAIRTRDLSKQAFDDPKWRDYALMSNEVNHILDRNTQDVLRKIIFVDLERLGFIHRYNRKRELCQLYERGEKSFVSISDVGLELLSKKDPLSRSFLIGKQMDMFLHGCIENLLTVLRDYNLGYIDIYEYMFFMTAIDFDSDFMLTQKRAAELIIEYRRLSPVQKKELTKHLKSVMITQVGDRKRASRRDFHNWKNEVQSLFNNFLKNLVYFKLENILHVKIMLSTRDGLFADDTRTRLDRSLQEKQLYMENHKVKKKDGFELHHVIPLAYSTSIEHFKLLDTWMNMIYIDAYSHRKIKLHTTLEKGRVQDLRLLDTASNEIYLTYKDNILYDPSKRDIMVNKNSDLRTVHV